jgi:hypothetical protein
MEQQTEKKGNTQKIIGVVAGIVFFAIAYYGVQQFFKPGFDKTLMEVASELNKTCPIMVDQDTRLDNAVALPGKIFQYNYTLVNYEKSQINIDTVRKYVQPNIVNTVRTNPDMKHFRDNKVTMDYHYKDKNGVFVLKISVTPDQYAD